MVINTIHDYCHIRFKPTNATLTNIVDNHENVDSTVLSKSALNSIEKFENFWLRMHIANSFPENVFSEKTVVELGTYFVYTQTRNAYSKMLDVIAIY